ncbi:MAG: SUMF1/EgtB/PvdO family nonheme iron enzyme, partial [Planctomycetota bacterium]
MKSMPLLIPLLAVLSALAAGSPNPAEKSKLVRTIVASRVSGQVPPGMVEVPAGKVVLGVQGEKALDYCSPDAGDVGCRLLAGCTPEANKEVPSFYIDVYEVTNLQYKTYLQATKRRPSPFLIQTSWNYQDKKTSEIVQGSYEPGRDHEPIVAITLAEAQACARWMNKRLPTEEEWTRAARGDDNRLYVWTGEWDAGKCSNSRTAKGKPVEVGKFKEDVSWCGIFDLMGNVSELTTSNYDPLPGFKPLKLSSGSSRGKSSLLSPEFSRRHIAAKGGNASGTPYVNSTFFRNPVGKTDAYALVGFRCAKAPTPGQDLIAAAAEQDLILLTRLKEVTWAWDDLAAQEINIFDKSARNLCLESHALAFAHPDRLRSNLAKIQQESVDEPVPVGIFTTTKPVLTPPLPPGSYAVYYKAPGEPKHVRKQKKAEATAKSEPDASTPKENGKPKPAENGMPK